MNMVAHTFGRRMLGERPGRIRAFVTAAATGFGAAVASYRVLRSRVLTRKSKRR